MHKFQNDNLNKINLFVFLIFFVFVILYALNFIKYYPIKSDAKDYFELALNYKANNVLSLDDLNNNSFRTSVRRSPMYPLLLSLIIPKSDINDVSTFNECYESNSKKDISLACSKILQKIQIFNFITYLLLFISLVLFSLYLGNTMMLLITGLLFTFNTFFLTKIMIVGPEIIASLFLFLSSIFLFFFFKIQSNFKYLLLILFSFFLSCLILTKEIYLYTYPFIWIIITTYIYKISSNKKYFKFFMIFIFTLCSLFLPYLWQKHKLGYPNAHSEKLVNNESIATGVLSLRAVYSTLDYVDYFPLLISFTPKIGNKVLLNIYDENKIYKFLEDNNSGRNYYYKNRLKIFNQIIKEKNYDNYFLNINNNNANQLRSILIIKDNVFKYIITLPIFFYRGLFPLAGLHEYEIIFKNFLNSKILLINKIFNYLINILSMVSLIFVLYFSLINNKIRNFLPFLIIPILSFLYHASLTHYIGRYSNILLPNGIICFSYLIFIFINKLRDLFYVEKI